MKNILRKIISNPGLSSLLTHMSTINGPVTIEDEAGNMIFGDGAGNNSERHSINLADRPIGWISGSPSSEYLAAMISYLASCQAEKRELAAETLSRYREINLFYDVSEKVGACLDPAEAARVVIAEARNIIKSSFGSVMIYDKESGLIREIAEEGRRKGNPASVTPGKGIEGSVFENGTPEIVNDVMSDARYGKGKKGVHSLICAPLKIKDQTIGLIALYSEDHFDYNSGDLKLLTAIASQAAALIENARLYSDLKGLHEAALDENREMKNYYSSRYSFQNIVTSSSVMKEALQLLEKVAGKPFATVAIFGENGTGKEILARAIHNSSGLLENRFVAVNCAAIPQNLLESELFGHVRGAFTGADREREGKFDQAQKGTLLLDEIGDMPLDLQAKLLRVLQERCYQKVGSNKTIKTEFRVIATTHRDLKSMVKNGQFREDLYHRLCMFPIFIPPLRERKDDIPLLVDYFMEQFQKEVGKPLPGISKAAMDVLLSYDWPGNVRELKNCIERATILSDDRLITPRDLNIRNIKALGTGGAVPVEISLNDEDFSLDSAINQILQNVLERCNGNKTEAANLLKVDRKLFYRRIS